MAATMDILSLTAAREWLGKTSAPDVAPKDDLILTQVARVSQWFEERTGRVLKKDAYVGQYRGNGLSAFYVRHYPIDATVEPTLSLREADGTWTVQDVSALEYDDPLGRGQLWWRDNVFPYSAERFNMKLGVTGGIAASPVELPDDVQLCGCFLLDIVLKMQSRGLHMVQSMADDTGPSTTYRSLANIENMMFVAETLRRYKRWVV